MRYLLLVAALMAAFVLAACGGDDDGDNGDSGAPAVESPVDDADGPADEPADDGDDGDDPGGGDEPADDPVGGGDDKGSFSLPDSTLAAPLTETYDTSGAPFDPANIGGVAAGTVIARWYQADGVYVVYYDGLDLAVTGPLCPGNSNRTSSGVFENISNAPTSPGACAGATTLMDPPVGVRLCGSDVLYVTAIPIDVADGLLFGTVESFKDDGTIVGLTSQVATDAAAAPEVDLSDCEAVG